MKIIVITGPTGVGKTKLSWQIAKKFAGEIINADSTQVYEGMEIATAKEINREIPHHLFSFKKWSDEYSVYDYQKDCRQKIAEIMARKKTPILVGGSGLYIKGALFDYQFSELKKENYQHLTNDELYQKLKEDYPNIDINNRRRLESAYVRKNKPVLKKEQLVYDVLFVGITLERAQLYAQINERVDRMFDMGLLEEARQVYESGIKTKAVLTPIGYKELFLYFANEISLDEAKELIKKKSRNYAKRQYTWFNNQMNIKWFYRDEKEKIIAYLEKNML